MLQSLKIGTGTVVPSLLESCEVIDAIRYKAGFLPEVELAYEPDIKTLWVTIRPELKPVFTLQLLDSLGVESPERQPKTNRQFKYSDKYGCKPSSRTALFDHTKCHTDKSNYQ